MDTGWLGRASHPAAPLASDMLGGMEEGLVSTFWDLWFLSPRFYPRPGLGRAPGRLCSVLSPGSALLVQALGSAVSPRQLL